MRFRILIVLVLLGIFVSTAQGQTNCCQIQVGGLSVSGGQPVTVAPNAGAPGPGGTYIPTETNTYPIACVNSDTGKPCNATSMPNNVVTANRRGR